MDHRFGAALALAALLLLAGCTDDADGEPADPAPQSAGPDDASPSDVTPVTPPAKGPETTTYEGEWNLGWSAAGDSNTAIGSNWPEHQASGDVTGVIVEMSWTPTTPTAQQMALRVQHGDADDTVEGASPLRFVVEGPMAAGSYRMAAVAAGEPGAYVHQAVTFHVTEFEGVPIDPAYSALAA